MTAHSFSSSLGSVINGFITLKRALGRGFGNERRVLAHLDRFLVESDADALTPDVFAAWSLTLAHLSPTTRRSRMRVVRNLCLYARRNDLDVFVPDVNTFPAVQAAQRPHIFSEEQISKLLRATGDLRARSTSPLCGEGYRLAIVLLYTAGLRRGELVRLIFSDFDPVERTLLIRASKFYKSRLVALSSDAVREMNAYLVARRRLSHSADAPLLVSSHRGLRARSGGGLGSGLRRLFERAQIRTATGCLPRVHDLRHTYAIHVLLRWYRSGVDVQSKLPALAAAMGHVSIVSTAYYLTLLDPVVKIASERFAQHSGFILGDPCVVGDER